MAHSGFHSPRRRLVRAIVLWVLFALTVAGAAAMARWKSGRLTTELASPAVYGPVELRLPKGWRTAARGRGTDVQIIAREPGTGRVLSLQTGVGGTQDEAREFLLRVRALAVTMGQSELSSYTEEVPISGGKARIIHALGDEGMPLASVALVSFDNGRTAVAELRTDGERTEADEMLLYSVTQSLQPRPVAPGQQTDSADEGVSI